MKVIDLALKSKYKRIDTGEIVEVLEGLDGMFMIGTIKPQGRIKKLRSKDYSIVGTRDECQESLDLCAFIKDWPEVANRDG